MERSVLVCSLKMGVNTPADEVIVRDTYFPGAGPVHLADLLQMIERAGRGSILGKGTVLTESSERANELVAMLVSGVSERIQPHRFQSDATGSCRKKKIGESLTANPIAAAVLSIVVRQGGTDRTNLGAFIQQSFSAYARHNSVNPDLALMVLERDKLIYRPENTDGIFHATKLGRTVCLQGLSPESGAAIGGFFRALFKNARRDRVVTEDPTEFVEPVRSERAPKIKRPFTLPELRTVLDLANDEWRSMVLFGLYSGQRLGDVATLRWNNIDLVHHELRLSTRKTGRTMILPLAEPLSNQFADLLAAAGLRPKRNHKSTGKGRRNRRESNLYRFTVCAGPRQRFCNEAGVAAAVAQALIGHDSEAMHELYVSAGREALVHAAASLPDLV